MAEDKKGFLLYADLIHTIEKMPNDKAGLLFKHILNYVNDLNPVTDDLIVELTFEPIKQQLKRDLLKYKETKIDKSNGGKLGNLKRWHKDLHDKVVKNELDINEALEIANNRKTSHTDNMQSLPIASIAVNDNVNVNDNVIKNNIEERKLKFANSLKPYLDSYGKDVLNNFFAYWSEHGPNDKKMRYEKEKSFNTHLRLIRWVQNDKTFKPKKEVLFTTPDGIEITDKTVLHTYKQTGLV